MYMRTQICDHKFNICIHHHAISNKKLQKKKVLSDIITDIISIKMFLKFSQVLNTQIAIGILYNSNISIEAFTDRALKKILILPTS